MGQAQRKPEFVQQAGPANESAARPSAAAEAFSDAIRHPASWRPSPAREMQEQLAAWAEQSGANPAASEEAVDAQIPALQRFAIITALSLALWAGIALVIAQFLPIW